MPEWLTLAIKIASGPVLGAIIGFFTNWLAVKMLFRPYKEKRIWRLRLPFTPGIIPKRKAALGRALGKAVGTQLVTPDDLRRLCTESGLSEKVGAAAAEAVFGNDRTPAALIDSAGGEGSAERAAESASGFLSDRILEAVDKLDLPSLITERAGDALAGIGGIGGLLGALGGNRIMTKLAGGIGENVQRYIDENGRDLLVPAVRGEIDKLLDAPVGETAEKFGLTREKVSAFAVRMYETVIVDKIAELVASFDIAGTVEKKVEEMDMAELEKLFMSVMKKELSAIVNLGGLLGGIVGILTSLINVFL